MRMFVGGMAIFLGVVGVVVCLAAAGLGWWAAVSVVDRVNRAAVRLDQGLENADAGLARVENRLEAVRADAAEARAAAERITPEDLELPRVRAEADRLFTRVGPLFDRAEAIAESLRLIAITLRTAADIAEQLNAAGPEPVSQARTAVDTIDRSAETLTGLRGRAEAVKTGTTVAISREGVIMVTALLTRIAAASDRLDEGLAAARREVALGRNRVAAARDEVAFWSYLSAGVNTILWAWGGFGQLCLIGWGRRIVRNSAARSGPGSCL